MEADGTHTLSEADEQQFVVAALSALGAPAARAELQARWLVEADLRGHHSHGLQRLPIILRRIRASLTDAGAEGRHEWRSGTLLAVDGERGLGPCVGLRAVQALIPVAKRQGVAVAAVSNANHLGILAPYTEEFARHGLIGLAITTSEALVHPWGGKTPLLGTNPIAIAAPAEPEPFSFDMATGTVSMGKILHHRLTGKALEPGWAVDVNGEPTTDPDAAITGALSPFGGAKGYGLALAIELIVASMTATALGRDVTGTLDADTACNKGDVFIALAPQSDNVSAVMSHYLDAIRADARDFASPAPTVPGDGARTRREQARWDGMRFPQAVLDEVRALACL